MVNKRFLWLGAVLLVITGAVVIWQWGTGGRGGAEARFYSVSDIVVRSFGDNFSGYGYIDQGKTDLYLDTTVTALTFPPLYELAPVPDAPNQETSLSNCIAERCLTFNGVGLVLDGRDLAWPAALQGKKILSANIQVLGGAEEARWVIGVVTGNASDERGWVYFYNGAEFLPLITDTTEARIEPPHNRLGGKIYFGGIIDDFLILYSGYDGSAFYYHDGKLTDVSRFFSLRVMAGGFPAQIIRASNQRGSVFFVCSRGGQKFKFIKIWSRVPGQLLGAIDLSHLIQEEGAVTGGCWLERGSDSLAVYVSFTQATSTKFWKFQDKGFDNSRDRQVVSKDLGEGSGYRILSAAITQFAAYADQDGSDQMFSLYLSADQENWREAEASSWYKFKNATGGLFWRGVFRSRPDDQTYSPWFDNINELLYKTVDLSLYTSRNNML